MDESLESLENLDLSEFEESPDDKDKKDKDDKEDKDASKESNTINKRESKDSDGDGGLIEELDSDIPDVEGAITLCCSNCSALYLQKIGDPKDDSDEIFAKSIVSMEATCPQCGELTRQIVVSAPLASPEEPEKQETAKPKVLSSTRHRYTHSTRLLSSTLSKLGVRPYGLSSVTSGSNSGKGTRATVTKIRSSALTYPALFSRFTTRDYSAYPGTTEFPDGSEPLIYNGILADIIVGGNEKGGVGVEVVGFSEDTGEKFAYYEEISNPQGAIRFAENLLNIVDNENPRRIRDLEKVGMTDACKHPL